MLQLTLKSLEGLFKKIARRERNAFGEFEYKDIRIIVKKPKLQLGRERSKRLYDYRRAHGMCIHCGAKVKNRNPLTGRLYRYCDTHRMEELERKKISRRRKMR